MPLGPALAVLNRRKTAAPLFPQVQATVTQGYLLAATHNIVMPATVNFATSSGRVAALNVYRISDWFGALAGVEVTTATSGTSAAPDSGSLTPSWGSLNTLWLSTAHATPDDAQATAAPASFTDLLSVVSGAGAAAGCTCASARRELNAASLDPGAFTLADTEFWGAFTVGVRPL